MKALKYILWCLMLLAFFACGRDSQCVSPEALDQAQSEYQSGFECLQADDLNEAFPHFLKAASLAEVLPEDMDDEQTLFVSRAYYQMGGIFGRKIESNLEIEVLKRACYYQEAVHDTVWLMRTWEQLIDVLQSVKESDSAQYYLDKLFPLTDSVVDFDMYQQVLRLVSNQYYDQKQYDSAFMTEQQLIEMKARRGMDTKRDSLSLGIAMFFSPRKMSSKPYLLKVLEVYPDTVTVESGAVMSLLSELYEIEGNADSVAFCNRFLPKYAQVESDRVSDGILLTKQYEQFKAERDARVQALREQKEAQNDQRKRLLFGGLGILLVLALLAFVWYHRRFKRMVNEQQEEISRDLRDARNTLEARELETLKIRAYAIYHDKLGHTDRRVMEVFTEAYPDALPKLKAAYPDLNETEISICVFSFFGFRVKEMADILDFRENTVAKYRLNIRKKTQTEDVESLMEPFLA